VLGIDESGVPVFDLDAFIPAATKLDLDGMKAIMNAVMTAA
jgi:hypothetical protein